MRNNSSSTGLEIYTSGESWLPMLAKAYKAKTSVTLIDDANLGVDPINETLLQMGRKANLTAKEWGAVLISLGMAGAGVYLLVMAIIDPEPFSKIAAALGTGAVMIFGGGFSAIRVLTGHQPPTVKAGPKGFEISFS
ncbi:hypothetical protein [Dyella lutea]|uniref:Uncharacterized protein n=1 Tax=Dyella lutea TaxID=2950441 RepID=A0ABT1FD54_9GAMM|nr:hypothetical protein [Dyella lutea]MCP1375308.1 hypothetical protein [Dyella lutea]